MRWCLWREAMGGEAKDPDPVLVQALGEHLDFYEKNPGQVASWETVRARITALKRS